MADRVVADPSSLVLGCILDFDQVGNKATTRSALDLDDDIQRIYDIRFDGSLWHLHRALQHARRETRNPLSSRVGKNDR